MVICRSFVRRHWAECVLAFCGLAAVLILLRLSFAPAQPIHPQQPQTVAAESEWEQIRKRIEARNRIIRRLGQAAVPVILREVAREGPYHFETVLALTQMGSEAVPGLIAAFNDSNVEVLLVALRTLSCLAPRIGAQADVIVPAAVQLLSHPNNEVRYAAVLLLGRLNTSRTAAVPALIAALKDPGDEVEDDPIYVRQSAAYVLGKIGPAAQAAIPELTNTLRDPTSGAQQEAAIALWRISRSTNLVVPLLSRMLVATNLSLRQQAETALARIHRDMNTGRGQPRNAHL